MCKMTFGIRVRVVVCKCEINIMRRVLVGLELFDVLSVERFTAYLCRIVLEELVLKGCM